MQILKESTIREPTTQESETWLEKSIFSTIPLDWETMIFGVILVLALLSRLIGLGDRVMSHDETSHVYFSWLLEQGRGYSHDPITHGPLQFHLMALSYFLFGDNDFTARLPHAIASILTIVFIWNYRRYLGKVGWVIAAFMLLISPFMLYYGRYARNEALVGLFGVVTLWAMLRYLETGASRYLYWLTAAVVLHFISKETAFIYTAQALIFLAVVFLMRVSQGYWFKQENRKRFFITLLLGIALFFGALFGFLYSRQAAPLSPTETVAPAIPGESQAAATLPLSPLILALGGAGLVLLLLALGFLARGYTMESLRKERSLDMLILLGSLVLPMLAPFPVKMIGWDPLDYSSTGMLRTGLFLVPLSLLALAAGLWWNARLWLGNAALFYAIYAIFYTTLFTNGAGFFTGIVGSLGYWLAQQGVNRGSQPWYYYLAVQIPIYEYLPALGSLLAVSLALFRKKRRLDEVDSTVDSGKTDIHPYYLAVTLLAYWSITSLLAYTIAGEKMPWLTYHIAWPMILLSAWGFGQLIESIRWPEFKARRGFLILAVSVVFLDSLTGTLGSALGTNPPFQGKQLEQLQATSTFLLSLLTLAASGWGIMYLIRGWDFHQVRRLSGLTFFGLLALLTARTSYTAAFINYDYANEFLVYAHSGPGPKIIFNQLQDISQRITDGLALQVAYDNKTTYPFWWYLRNFPNQRYYAKNPTRDLREVPVILVGDENYGKIEPIVGQAFNRFQYVRIWWPNQDYFNLTWDRIWGALTNPAMRSALFQIWLNRDFTAYGQITGRDMSYPNWQPSESMRMYIRKDIVAQIWNYGVGPSAEEVVADPYEGKETTLTADVILGSKGTEPGQFNRPRDLEVAPDGSIYIADTENHRIQHLAPDGSVLHIWGSFADIALGAAPGGTFNQPWGIGLGPDGSVYVADTWNHRIQKFSAQGEFIKMWGYFGQAETPDAFWGPRDVVVDQQGRVLVSDTGNKRIAIFDADGNFITQFGEQGFDPGQFNEPVGLALDPEGRLFVADTWNQRVQAFRPDGAGGFQPEKTWDIYGWFGQSLDNKPYLTVGKNNHLFVTDPEGNRILEFTLEGEIVRFWGDYSLGDTGFDLAGAVAADARGGVWVSDVNNGRIMHFSPPEE